MFESFALLLYIVYRKKAKWLTPLIMYLLFVSIFLIVLIVSLAGVEYAEDIGSFAMTILIMLSVDALINLYSTKDEI